MKKDNLIYTLNQAISLALIKVRLIPPELIDQNEFDTLYHQYHRRDWRGCDFQNVHLTDYVRGISLAYSVFNNVVDLQGCLKDSGSTFEHINLKNANLRYFDLSGVNLSFANLVGANLYMADLRGANLFGANLCGANLTKADLHGANLRGAKLYQACMEATRL
jgi:uncharacterized protein YjbI with pentapeptide repeats